MVRILAIETATDACSVALYHTERELLESCQVTPRQHATQILPMITDLLAQAGWTCAMLDLIAFGQGPGSFTGLRIAASVAKTLAFALDRPVSQISTLAALALQGLERMPTATQIWPVIDARMREVYWGQYVPDTCRLVRPLQPDQLGAPQDFCPREPYDLRYCLGLGSGWRYDLTPFAEQQLCPDLLPKAKEVARLAAVAYERGDTCSAQQAKPLYLRNKVTSVPKRLGFN